MLIYIHICTKNLWHSMEKRVVEKVVGRWDQRKGVENDEMHDGMC